MKKTQFENHFAINLNSACSSSAGIPRTRRSILFDSAVMTMNEMEAAPVNTAHHFTAVMLFKHERMLGGDRGGDKKIIRMNV